MINVVLLTPTVELLNDLAVVAVVDLVATVRARDANSMVGGIAEGSVDGLEQYTMSM